MRITQVVFRHIRLRLKKPFKHASHVRHETENVIVECRSKDGKIGFGEGVPRDYVTGETVKSARTLLKQADYTLLAKSCDSFESAIERIDSFPLPVIDIDPRGIQGNAARCALELAFLDLVGKSFGKSLSHAVKFLTPTLYQPIPQTKYGVVIGSASGSKLRWLARLYKCYGFRQMKLKVGIPGLDDEERLDVLRSTIGQEIELHVDANESWNVKETVRWSKKLEDYKVSWIEQPVAHELMDELGQHADEMKIPIMLDESLCGMKDAEDALAYRRGRMFNLRISKCGGFLRTLRLAEFAHQHGIACQLGCQVGESAILSAAGRHFACSVRSLAAVEGSYDRRLLRENIGETDLTFGKGGIASALTGPGLGIEINRRALERVTVSEEVFFG